MHDKTLNTINSSKIYLSKSMLLHVGLLCISLCLITITTINSARASMPSSSLVDQDKYAAFIMEAETGLVLHQYNADKSLHPASLTKMMTLLMLFDAIDHGEINLHDQIYISKHAASMIPSKIGLAPGSTISVKDAIHALAVKSANDIAVAVAEKLGKSEYNFAMMMTKKARSLGMSKTRFMNASGLHNKYQVSTARDMAKLSQVLVNRYKKHYHYFSLHSFTYQGTTYTGHNKLMKTYPGMDGLKTGYINASGFNLASSAVQDGFRLVGVVFGGKTSRTRNAQMEKLLDQGFAKLESTTLIAENAVPIPQRKPTAYTQHASAAVPINNSARNTSSRWSVLNSQSQNNMFNRMIGQGDYDITVRNRIETGLIAISSHLGEAIPDYIFGEAANAPFGAENKTSELAKMHPTARTGSWAIQVGAFVSRESAYQAISNGKSQLPGYLDHGHSIIAPLQTKEGWVFRGRLHGYSKEAAHDACRIINDCIPISPTQL